MAIHVRLIELWQAVYRYCRRSEVHGEDTQEKRIKKEDVRPVLERMQAWKVIQGHRNCLDYRSSCQANEQLSSERQVASTSRVNNVGNSCGEAHFHLGGSEIPTNAKKRVIKMHDKNRLGEQYSP